MVPGTEFHRPPTAAQAGSPLSQGALTSSYTGAGGVLPGRGRGLRQAGGLGGWATNFVSWLALWPWTLGSVGGPQTQLKLGP